MLDSLLRGSLSSRLIRLIGVPAMLFLLLVIAFVGVQSFRRTVEQNQEAAMNAARTQSLRLDGALGEASRIPEMHARILESGALHGEEQLRTYLTEVMARSRDIIYGSCLSFEPNSYAPALTHYAPYSWWNGDVVDFKNLASADYNYFEWEWYHLPKKMGAALWTEPYFDDGGGEVLMTTRSVPFFQKQPDGTRAFWGVATIDISLEQLIKHLRTIKITDTGYALLISKGGRYLVHPDASKIMKNSVHQDNAMLAGALMSGGEGFLRTSEPVGNRDAWIAYSPVQHSGFTLALVYPTEEIMRPAYTLVWELVGIAIAGVLALFTALVIISRSVSRPVTRLVTAVQRVAGGDLDHRLDEMVNITEVRDLTTAFSKMTKDLRMRMEELRYTTTLKERMAGELNAARRIQMSMLPKQLVKRSEWPHLADVSLNAVIQPAREVGGDFYDYRFLDEQRLSILIGDVSGKGVPAALFMAMTQTLFKGHASPERTTMDIMKRVNDALCEESQTGMFVTLIYAVLHVQTGKLELCNAGHPPPCLLTASGEIKALESVRNPALGLKRKLEFRCSSFDVQPGEKIVFYTDGVTEAFNSAQELYSHARLDSLLKKHSAESVEAITTAVITDVRAHSGNEEPSDDLTVVTVMMPASAAA